MRILKCHPGIGACVEGEALVSGDNFSARYDLDRRRGVFSRPEHKLAGQSFVGKVLVFDQAKGGVASAWMLHEMVSRGAAPIALLFNAANTILAQGAAFADLPLCDRFKDGDVTRLIRTGDRLRIDPPAGQVVILQASD